MTIQDLTSARILADGGRLLAVLAGDSPITFQTFNESPTCGGNLARTRHGALAVHAKELADLNEAGASINFMVNHGDGRRRASANVIAVRSLFVDLDGAPIEGVHEGPLRPHAIVRTSPGRFHAYWAVEGVTLADFTPLQKAIAARFDGDSKITDLARVMRLPGSIHRKGEPTPCEIIELDDFPRYSREAVAEAFRPGASPPRAAPRLAIVDGAIVEGERNDRLFDLARSFVNKGLPAEQVLERIQRVNATKCSVPLCASEVDAIVASAVRHGPSGYLNLPLRVVDSLAWRNLSHSARTIAVTAYRRYNGTNNGNISLPFSDFGTEFRRTATFYKARHELERAGLITLARKHRYDGWAGRQPDLYSVALEPPSVPSSVRSEDT